MAPKIDIFFEQPMTEYCAVRIEGMRAEVQSETPEHLLNVNEEEYKNYLHDRYEISPLFIHFDDMEADVHEEDIPADRHPRFDFDRPGMRGKSFPRQVVRYLIPFEGDEQLLRCTPNPRLLSTEEVEVGGGYISFDVIDFYSDADRLRLRMEQIVKPIKTQFKNLQINVSDFNQQLAAEIDKAVSVRRDQLSSRLEVVANLGVPIRKSSTVPETFRVPTVRKTIVPKPMPRSGSGTSEPTLGDDVYREILQVIHDTGKVFERLPGTYSEKSEPDLRDHLVLQLEPRFEGSTTGETFNKSGKTDILIRHENSNIFVAECKFWDGAAAHEKTIDQLLRYLTWRDSKTAVVVFVNRKDFSAVLSNLIVATENHPCFVARTSTTDESWIDFEFHLPDDPDRLIKLAALVFHLPETERP